LEAKLNAYKQQIEISSRSRVSTDLLQSDTVESLVVEDLLRENHELDETIAALRRRLDDVRAEITE
jgi:hypothetical protein